MQGRTMLDQSPVLWRDLRERIDAGERAFTDAVERCAR